MEHPEEELILYDDEDKYEYVIDEEVVDFEGVRKSSRGSRPVDHILC